MSAQRNVSQSVLQVMFSVFVGLVVVAFVAIAVMTFYPEPSPPTGDYYGSPLMDQWRLVTGIILLVASTIIMVVSLVRSERLPVLFNGVLLGGVFTMVYAVGMSLSAPNEWPRLLVITLALVVTIGVAILKFGVRPAAKPAAAAAGDAAGGDVADSELAERVRVLEAKLAAIAHTITQGA